MPAADESLLPPVHRKMRERILNLSEFVDLSELLPANRMPGTSKFGEKVRIDPNFQQNQQNQIKKEYICDFVSWTRAYYVFMAYRVNAYPEVTLPMLRYQDIIASLADPIKGYPLNLWFSYDSQFRPSMSIRPTDFEMWGGSIRGLFRNSWLWGVVSKIAPALVCRIIH